jgi:hypothetical protein
MISKEVLMRKIFFALLVSVILQACSTAKLTPEEQDEIRERRERLLEVRGFHV